MGYPELPEGQAATFRATDYQLIEKREWAMLQTQVQEASHAHVRVATILERMEDQQKEFKAEMKELSTQVMRIDKTVHNGMQTKINMLAGCVDNYVTKAELSDVVAWKLSEFDSQLQREQGEAKKWVKGHKLELLAALIGVLMLVERIPAIIGFFTGG